jgi:beta-lactamase regulating signal transducer with metallopeptidase domain
MIETQTFLLIAATLIFIAGKKDIARDPKLTLILLALLIVFPLASSILPKFQILPSASISDEPTATSHWISLAMIIWATGFILFSSRLGYAALKISKWRKQSVLLEKLDHVAICQLEGIKSPFAVGILKPVIFVPKDWTSLPEESREMIIAHEMAHHHRRDPLWRLLAEITRAVHWYHPLAHWMCRRFTLQTEFACDELALRKGIHPKNYARLLCDCAEHRPSLPLALAMADSSSLEKRVSRISARTSPSNKILIIILSSCGITCALALSTIERKSTIPLQEIQLRLSANPFPGEP